MSVTSNNSVDVHMSAGGLTLIADGVSFSASEDSWVRAELSMTESAHLQAVHILWEGANLGDYGWLGLCHPAGQGSPASQIEADDTAFTITGKGAYYNPAGGAQFAEFWDASDNLIEIAKIASVAGDVVTLETTLKNQHLTSAVIRACYGHHTSPRGTDSISGGMRFLGTGHVIIGSENQMTAAIPAGMVLGGRFKMSSEAGTRKFVVNFKMRRV